MTTARGVIALQPAPAMEPLARSGHVEDSEVELRAVFMALFEQHIRPALADVETLGMPQVGSTAQFEVAARTSGLEIYRRDEADAMRLLYQSWAGVNPRRGLAMIRLYLAMLWPGSTWKCVQLWQRADKPYPTALSETGGPGYWLTSRVRIELEASGMDASDVRHIRAALMSVVPAKFVIDINVKTAMPVATMRLAGAAYGRGLMSLTGTASTARTQPAASLLSLAGAAYGRGFLGLTGTARPRPLDEEQRAGANGPPDFPKYVPT